MVFLVIFHHQLVKKGPETFRPQLTVGYDIIVPQNKQPEVLVPPAGLSCLGTSCWAACCLLSRNLRPGSQLSHYLRRKASSHLTNFSKHPEPTSITSSQEQSTTNPRKFTYQKPHTSTREVSDARRIRSHLLPRKLHRYIEPPR